MPTYSTQQSQTLSALCIVLEGQVVVSFVVLLRGRGRLVGLAVQLAVDVDQDGLVIIAAAAVVGDGGGVSGAGAPADGLADGLGGN